MSDPIPFDIDIDDIPEPDAGPPPSEPPKKPTRKKPRRSSQSGPVSDGDAIRVPPHSIEAEEGVLACCLMDPEVLSDCINNGFGPDHFYKESHKIIFEGLHELHATGEPFEGEIGLFEHLRKKGLDEEIGGIATIYAIQDRVETTVSARYLARVVQEKYLGRCIIRKNREITEKLFDGEDVSELMDELRAFTDEVAADSASFRFPEIINAEDLVRDFVSYRPEIVAGILRAGEVANVIAAPKVGKSHLVLLLAIAVANGVEWLGLECYRRSVLLVDNELHSETLAQRIRSASKASGLPASSVNVWPIRGACTDIETLAPELIRRAKKCNSGLIVLDALYRLLPSGTSESDNAEITAIYNRLDAIARATGAAILVVHHASKGSQSEKSVTDGGSGAGAISRAADSHIFLRPHEDEGRIVVDAVARSFPPPGSFVIVHEGGTFRRDETADPHRIAGRKASTPSNVTGDAILEAVGDEHEAVTTIAARLEESGIRIPVSRLRGRLDLLVREGRLHGSRGERGARCYGRAKAEAAEIGTKSERIAAHAKENPSLSQGELAALFDCSERTVRRALNS